MADNRQFADHGVIGGVDVFYEDKKLAESPSQSSVASTDYFVLKDTDGVPHKIVKSDVLEMVRDAMGTILANNNKGTSVAKVPTIGSSGNDLGSSSVADLASVLGVESFVSGNQITSGSLDDITINGWRYVNSEMSPSSREGWLKVEKPNGNPSNVMRTIVQTFYQFDGQYIKRRMKNWDTQNWTSWIDI